MQLCRDPFPEGQEAVTHSTASDTRLQLIYIISLSMHRITFCNNFTQRSPRCEGSLCALSLSGNRWNSSVDDGG